MATRAGDVVWLRFPKRMVLSKARIVSVDDEGCVVESGRGGRLRLTRKKMIAAFGRTEGEPKFYVMTVALSGGWREIGPFRTLREAVERAYWHASKHHTRYVNLSRVGRHGLKTGIGMMAGHDGRVWLGRCGSLSPLAWQGEEPAPGTAVEITGRYAEPVDWII